MKLRITNKELKNWELLKKKLNGIPTDIEDSYYGNLYVVDYENELGWKFWWNKPMEVLWLSATDNKENYEGSQTQFGVKKDGTIVWAFFSHCSCYYYEDYGGNVNNFKEKDFKSYELENVPKEIMLILKDKMKRIRAWLKEGIKEVRRNESKRNQ